MIQILSLIWLFLPAGIANMAPIFASKIPWLAQLEFPMDFNLKFQRKRIFGPHKTIRGLVAGIIFGIATVWVQRELYTQSEFIQTLSFLDYSTINIFQLGTLLGAGALIGDATKSFFKRQLNIPSGKSWFPFDQIDYIIGAAFFIAPIHTLSIGENVLTAIIFFTLHVVVTYIGYLLKLKKDPI